MKRHLRQAWAAIATPTDQARFSHVFLPDDPQEAHRALVALDAWRRTGVRRHADAINSPEPGHYDTNRLHDLVSQGGFSSHPWRNDAPTHGYMASHEDPKGDLTRTHHISEITPDHIADHRDAMGDHLRNRNTYQGGWLDHHTGNVHLDPSKHFNSENSARKFALDNKQLAYFNLNTFQDHYLDPARDPLYHADPAAHADKYRDVYRKYGPGAPKQYQDYKHLYEEPAEQHKAKEAARNRLAGVHAERARLGMKLDNGYWP